MQSKWKPRRFEIFVMAGLVFGLWAVVTLAQAHKRAEGANCQSNMKQLGLSVNQYIRDYDEKYPLARQWREDLSPYQKEINNIHCPVRKANGYAYNRYLHGQDYDRVDNVQGLEKTPLFFESVLLEPNASDFGKS